MPKVDIFSPDGIPLRDTPFKTKREAVEYYQEWIKRFEGQGYYSSNSGRIPLENLSYNCVFGIGAGIRFAAVCSVGVLLALDKLP